MLFSEWTNDHVLLLFLLLAVALAIGVRLGLKRGGWNQHLPYMFTLIISIQYYLLSPLYFYLTGKKIIIGTDISGYYGLGVFFPLLGMLFFLPGYWLVNRKKKSVEIPKLLKPPTPKVGRYIIILFCIIYSMVLINMAISGIEIENVFLGDETLGLGAKGETYFLQNFADSLISLVILGYIYGTNRRILIVGIIMSFFLFSLLGFRYRILLTLFGLAFAYLYFHRLQARTVVVGIVSMLIFFYFVMLITENRFLLIQKEYSQLNIDPLDFDYSNYFEQTRGSLADMAIYKVYDNPNKVVSHDYGASMFAYIFVRMIPRVVYPDKDEFYPPPQNKVQFIAYDAWWSRVSGEAILSCACFYIAFGWFGIILFHFLWGVLLARLKIKLNLNNRIQLVLYIVVALVSFQWITRAYLPQAIDHAVYLSIPIFILRYFIKSESRVSVPLKAIKT